MKTPDAPARQAVIDCITETMFLEAGAGSGKTTSLVDRFVALVESGVEADRIAAITFTERAAGELSDRIRTRLQELAGTSERCRVGLGALDRAAICTLHSFALRVLTHYPIEAGLPPRLTVLDEISSQLAFEERWTTFVDRVLEDPKLERTMRLLLAVGTKLTQLRDVAVQFSQSWDLVAERAGGPIKEIPPLDLAGLDGDLAALAALAAHGRAGDGLLTKCEAIAEWGVQLRAAIDDDALLALLTSTRPFKAGTEGRRPAWPDKQAVLDAVKAVENRCTALRDEVQQACIERIAEELAIFTMEAARARQAEGELEFHDLLVLSRAMLRNPVLGPEVRAALANRHQRLLLDEFQDTDPIQVELAVLIASADPDAGTKGWRDIEVEPGRLFFVGDPKQSIYRFRRADIGVFLAARDHVGGRVEHLTSNFRTGPPILEWVNHVFGELIHEVADSQPAYVPLHPVREAAPSGPAVSFVGCEEHPKTWRAPGMRDAEARDVALAIRKARDEAWQVQDQDTDLWRSATWRDIAILLPARTSLRQLEQALDTAGVPYRVETSSLVYGTREVRDLLMVARAIEDPTDSLAVVSALRTPAFGCGDDDLYRWKHEHHGRWDHQGHLPDGDHIVGRGLAWLGEMHRRRLWLSPSQLLERTVRERRIMEVAYVHPRPRDLWRRLRFVVDQCRAWEEAGGTTLRDYLAWVRLQAAEGSRVLETVLPETDDEAVRILTVHGAKGLEFPITVLSGLTTQWKPSYGGVQVLFPKGNGWAVRLKKDLETIEFRDEQPIEEQMGRHERLRLLYVAATRARDHLIVSVHRKVHGGKPTAAELFHLHGSALATELTFDDDTPPAKLAPPPSPSTVHLTPFDEWEQELTDARMEASRPVAVSPTRLAREAAEAAAAEASTIAGIKKDPRDLDLPPWQKGRYGSAIGRAVHGVLQTVDFVAGDGLREAVDAQAAAEGVLGRESVIEALSRSALSSDIIKRAATRPHWRELYIGVPHEDDCVLEGYVDLLYRDDDGLVVVDYKTDAWRNEAELAAKVERYSAQLQSYAAAVTTVVGEPVVRCVLLFLVAAAPSRAVLAGS